MTAPGDERPVLRVVKGDPTPEELAAVVAVVQARVSGKRPAERRAGAEKSGWSAYWRSVRQPLHHGPGGWRASGLPK